MNQQFIAAFEDLYKALITKENLSSIQWGLLETFLLRTISEQEFEELNGPTADDLIDKIIQALSATTVYDDRVLNFIGKLCCFYGSNPRAFIILSKYTTHIPELSDVSLTSMLLTRLAKVDENAWRMAKLCSTLVTCFSNHRHEAAKILLKNNFYKFGDIITKSKDFMLQCYFIELINNCVPVRVHTRGPPFVSVLWPEGPEELWTSLPSARSFDASYFQYLKSVDKIFRHPLRPNVFPIVKMELLAPISDVPIMVQISSTSLLLMKPKSHTNLEIELLEFWFKHLVRTTKKSSKSMQYTFTSSKSQVLFSLDNRTWNSVSLILEFEDENSEKQFSSQVMNLMKNNGYNVPEVYGVNSLKMSVVDTKIDVSSYSALNKDDIEAFPSSSDSSMYMQPSPLPARRKMSQGDSIISLNEKSCPAIPRPPLKLQDTQPPQPTRAGSIASITKFLPIADSKHVRLKNQPDKESVESQLVINETSNPEDQSSFVPAKIQKVLDDLHMTPIVPRPAIETSLNVAKPQNIKKITVSVPVKSVVVNEKRSGYKSDEDEFWDPPTQSKKEIAIASKNVSPVPPAVQPPKESSSKTKRQTKKVVVRGKARVKEPPKPKKLKGKSDQALEENTHVGNPVEESLGKKGNNVENSSSNIDQSLTKKFIEQSLEHEKPDEMKNSTLDLLEKLIKPEEIAQSTSKTQGKTLNPKKTLDPSSSPDFDSEKENEEEYEDEESDQPTRRSIRASRRVQRLKKNEKEKVRRLEEILEEKKRKEEESKKKREERALKRREDDELRNKREEVELKEREDKLLEENRKKEKALEEKSLKEEEALKRKHDEEALEKKLKARQREEALMEAQKRKEASDKSKKGALEKKRKQGEGLEKEEKKRPKVEVQAESKLPDTLANATEHTNHRDHIEVLSTKPSCGIVSPPVDSPTPEEKSVASVVTKVLENLGRFEPDEPSIATVVSTVLANLNKPCKETQNAHETKVEQPKEESSSEFTGVSSILKGHGNSFGGKGSSFSATFDTPVKMMRKDLTKPMRGPVAFSTPRNAATSSKVTKTEGVSKSTLLPSISSSSTTARLNSLKGVMATKEKNLSFGTPIKVERVLATETATPVKKGTKDVKGSVTSFIANGGCGGEAPNNGGGANNSTNTVTSGSPTLNNYPRVFTTMSPWESAPDTYQAQKDRFLEAVTGQRETFSELLGHLTRQVVRKMEFVEMRMLKDTEQFEEWFERAKDRMKVKEDGWRVEKTRLDAAASQVSEQSLASLKAWAVLQK